MFLGNYGALWCCVASTTEAHFFPSLFCKVHNAVEFTSIRMHIFNLFYKKALNQDCLPCLKTCCRKKVQVFHFTKDKAGKYETSIE